MNLILYHKTGGRSAPRLAAFMGIKAVRALTRPVDCLIRWGLATEVKGVEREINPRSSLVRYFTRQKQLELLKAGKVSVPEFKTTPDVGFPMLGRDEGNDRQPTRGRGITFYPEQVTTPLPAHSFYMRFYPKQRQFRVHVIAGSTRTRELIPDYEPGEPMYGLGEGMHRTVVDRTEDLRAQPIWNLHTGFTYRNLTLPRPNGVISQARRAVKALKLDFGAVDVIVHDGTPYVLEVNTAPGLHELTLSWYARHLAPLIGLDPLTMPGLQQETQDVQR